MSKEGASNDVLQQVAGMEDASKPLVVFWTQWRSFLDQQLMRRQAESQSQRQWQARVLSRALSGWTEYKQQREAAANLLRQWKEKRALEDQKSPALQASPSFSIHQGFPQSFGPRESRSADAGLGLLAVSLGSLFKKLQVKRGGDLQFRIVESSNQTSGADERGSSSPDSDSLGSPVLYANSCILCQRVPYVAAAVRFARQKLDKQSEPDSAASIKLCLSGEECSAAGVRAVLEWAYSSSFMAQDWREVLEAVRAGSYLGAFEVVHLSQGWLLEIAAPLGRELEREGRSAEVRDLWRSVVEARSLTQNGVMGAVDSRLPARGRWLDVEKNPLSLSRETDTGTNERDGGNPNATGSKCLARKGLVDSSGLQMEAADIVSEVLTVLTSCGLETAASAFLQRACPSVVSLLFILLHLDFRIPAPVLGLLLEWLDELRGTSGPGARTGDAAEAASSGVDTLNVGVLVVLGWWWGIDPESRFASARALLEEHVCLGALDVSNLEALIAQCRKGAVEDTSGLKSMHAAGLLRLDELEAAYGFALRMDNKYGRDQRLVRQTVAQWKFLNQSKAWRSWHEFCQDGLGTSRLILAKRALRIWSVKLSARYFVVWRQATTEGKIEERQRLALWKWRRACQKLLRAKLERS